MKCRILHESGRRIRVHIYLLHMTPGEADKLQYYLEGQSFIRKAKVNERTSNAVIIHDGSRKAVIEALACFDIAASEVSVPEHTGRELRIRFEDRLFFLVTGRLISRLFFPGFLRRIIRLIKAFPYILKGLTAVFDGKMEVSILDAISIAVSIVRGDFETAGSVMFLLKLGGHIEDYTRRKSVDDLARRMSLNCDRVWVKAADGQEILVNISDVKEGDTAIVRTGSVIPLDGIVDEGEALVNQSSMTGESKPVRKAKESPVYAGTVLDEGELFIRVQKAHGSGRYDRIVAMIGESEKMKSRTEDRASHLADRLVPYTLGAALFTYLFTGNATKAASALMVDYCCALKLAIPISVLSAMREAGEHQISVKGGKFMEAVAEAETIVFDKTGTLTKASPKVKKVVAFGGNDEREMLRLAACLEEHYPHSIANAVVREAEERGLSHEEKHTKATYVVAHGIASTIDGKRVCIGSYHFVFEDEGCIIPPEEAEIFKNLPDEYSHLYIAIEKELSAVILIDDPLKTEAVRVIAELKKLGFGKVVMMTGDNERTARVIALKTDVTHYYSEVLPEDKAEFIRKEHAAGKKVIMIGDGINDSPALSEADAGIAVSTGASIAREIADITISTEDLGSLITLRRLSTGLMDRIRFNYRSIIGFNSFLMLMGILGVFTPTVTALLHNASTVAISLKSMTDILNPNRP